MLAKVLEGAGGIFLLALAVVILGQQKVNPPIVIGWSLFERSYRVTGVV
jgi:hypothetical protein